MLSVENRGQGLHDSGMIITYLHRCFEDLQELLRTMLRPRFMLRNGTWRRSLRLWRRSRISIWLNLLEFFLNNIRKEKRLVRLPSSVCAFLISYLLVIRMVISAESKPPFLPTRLVTIAALLRRYSPSPHRLLRLLSHVPDLVSINQS